MKLDFSALAQPAAKVRGQLGTTGTPVSTRVCVSPLAQPGAGTGGDKPAAVVLVAELVVAIHAACPPVSPACPQVPTAEKLNAGAVSPVSPLVPTDAAQVAPVVRFEREDLAGKPTGASVNACGNCLHLLRRGTCAEPVAAGLAQNFAIAWPSAGYGASCAAFTPKPAPEAAGRAYALTEAQGDVAHAEAWDDAACALFVVRTARIQRRGFSEPDATDLAEQLHLRDVRADSRHACLECKHLAGAVSTGWRCGNHNAAGLNAAQVAADLVVMQQYCQGFADEGGGYA